MSKGPNLMSTQDDPEDAPWLNNDYQFREPLQPPKPNAPIQFYSESILSSWLKGTAVGSAGTLGTLMTGAQPARLNITITPNTGSMTIDPQPIQVNVSDSVTASDGPKDSAPPSKSNVDWLEQLSCVLPRHLREAILGDVCERRAEMAAKGFSHSRITWMTWFQLLLSTLDVLLARLGWIIAIFK